MYQLVFTNIASQYHVELLLLSFVYISVFTGVEVTKGSPSSAEGSGSEGRIGAVGPMGVKPSKAPSSDPHHHHRSDNSKHSKSHSPSSINEPPPPPERNPPPLPHNSG